jgi:hypothetical protein
LTVCSGSQLEATPACFQHRAELFVIDRYMVCEAERQQVQIVITERDDRRTPQFDDAAKNSE